jgi:hypothetical protein
MYNEVLGTILTIRIGSLSKVPHYTNNCFLSQQKSTLYTNEQIYIKTVMSEVYSREFCSLERSFHSVFLLSSVGSWYIEQGVSIHFTLVNDCLN